MKMKILMCSFMLLEFMNLNAQNECGTKDRSNQEFICFGLKKIMMSFLDKKFNIL